MDIDVVDENTFYILYELSESEDNSREELVSADVKNLFIRQIGRSWNIDYKYDGHFACENPNEHCAKVWR